MEDFILKKKSPDDFIIALAGNPNVGKSSIFNELTGLRQHTGNWPGKTVGLAQGYREHNGVQFVVVDLPGTYSLAAHSAEEEVARDFIQSPDSHATIIVCDATSLERNLNLVLQILYLTPNVILAVNLMDEAKKKKITIDLPLLSQRLGVPVIGTSATKKEGISQLLDAVLGVARRDFVASPCLRCQLSKLNPDEEEFSGAILKLAEQIASETVVYHKEDYDHFERKLDKILTQKKTGLPIMLALLFTVFWITISAINIPSDLLARFFEWFGTLARGWAELLPLPDFFIRLFFEGIYEVLATVISVMFPPMAVFFPIFTLLEDFGYLPRVAFNLDKIYQRAGTCGKQALTMCMGFGCNAAGIVGARIIDSPRERLIAIITNNFVPCNGRFPILISVIAMFFVAGGTGILGTFSSAALLTGIILLGVLSTFWISKLLSQTVLKGIPSSFALELPPYRKPLFRSVLARSLLDRTLFVLGRAVLVAAPAGAVIFIMANIQVGDYSVFAHATNFLDPFARLMGLDGTILLAFILGLPANEIVIPLMIMGYMSLGTITELNTLEELRTLLLSNGWTWLTAANVLLFTIYHWPCSTSLLTILKETKSLKWTVFSFAIPTFMGIVLTMSTTLLFHIFS